MWGAEHRPATHICQEEFWRKNNPTTVPSPIGLNFKIIIAIKAVTEPGEKCLQSLLICLCVQPMPYLRLQVSEQVRRYVALQLSRRAGKIFLHAVSWWGCSVTDISHLSLLLSATQMLSNELSPGSISQWKSTGEKAIHRELPTRQEKWGTINTHNSQQ